MQNENSTPKKRSNTFMYVAIAVLLLLAAWLFYERMQLKEQNTNLKTELRETNSEKSNVKNELAELLVEYENMKTDNDTLNAQLQAEQEKIQQLLDEIQTVKRSNAVQIARYKREIKTLRKVMRSFVVQIDSLNTKNKELTAQVRATQTKYKSVVEEKKQLEEKRDSLSSRVEVAATLIADNIQIETLNKRDNKTSRARKAVKVKVCFTIRDNPVAKTGNLPIYLRIADPQGNVLTPLEYTVFQADGNELAASAMREVFYNGDKTDACVYFVSDLEFVKGEYSVDIFEGGQIIGEAKFRLR